MLIKADQSLLLVIDIQERLAPAIHDTAAVTAHNLWLVEVARRLTVPVLATVQYPKGLGPLVPALADKLAPEEVVEKIHFSAVADGCLENEPAFARRQVVITGTETHVCVLQTALDLLGRGKEVFVVAEAVGSRRPEDKALALERLRQAGCVIVSREMVAFEWLHRAGTDLFRAVSREFIR
ncbi:hydrolase [Azospira sp. I13]|uniref:hydrolase n=1 Tax=Azospira sp. I13 TaxID=1765050 RepID=UPI000D42AF26|nr:hydrolase [Azospira sp. I13]GBG03490.1 hydrolase [Azospira sp. I13]